MLFLISSVTEVMLLVSRWTSWFFLCMWLWTYDSPLWGFVISWDWM